MSRAARPVLLGVVLGMLALPAPAGEGKGSYLTADGELKATLEVVDVQGGFAGFTGTHVKVTKDGKWEVARVFKQKLELQRSGKLNKGQLMKLGEALAKYDALGLKDEGKAGANPHRVTVRFGKHKATLTLGAGKPLPPPSTTEIPGRFSGVAHAVGELVKKGAKGAGGEK